MLQVIEGGAPTAIGLADYVWLGKDGLRCKKRAIQVPQNENGDPVFLGQRWVCQEGLNSHILVPAYFIADPLRPPPSFIALCEVKTTEDMPVAWSPRSSLKRFIEGNKSTRYNWVGFRQPYELIGDRSKMSYVAERHLGACLDAGLLIHSAEVSLDGCHFKIGPRGFNEETDPDQPSALTAADHLVLATHLLIKVALDSGLGVKFKPFSVYVSTLKLRTELSQAEANRLSVLLKNLSPRVEPRPVLDAVRRGVVAVEYHPTQASDPYAAGQRLLTSI